MSALALQPAARARGTVRLPGSKSISNRVLLLAALAEGTTEVKALLESDDTRVMLEALRQLGVGWSRHGESDDYRVEGVGGPFPAKRAAPVLVHAVTDLRAAAKRPTAHRAGAHREHDFRRRHRIVGLAQGQGHVFGHGAGDEQPIGGAAGGPHRGGGATQRPPARPRRTS